MIKKGWEAEKTTKMPVSARFNQAQTSEIPHHLPVDHRPQVIAAKKHVKHLLVTVHYDLLYSVDVMFAGDREYLSSLTYADVRHKLTDKIDYSYMFVKIDSKDWNFCDRMKETDKIMKDYGIEETCYTMVNDGENERKKEKWTHVYLAQIIPALDIRKKYYNLNDRIPDSEFKLRRFFFGSNLLCTFGITPRAYGFNAIGEEMIDDIFDRHVTKKYDNEEIELLRKSIEIEGNPVNIELWNEKSTMKNLSAIKLDEDFSHTSIRDFTLKRHEHYNISLDGILSSMTDTPQASQALTLIDCHDDACLHAVKSMIRSLPRDIDYRLVDASMLTDFCLLIEATRLPDK